MTQEVELARIVALAIKTATAPLLERLAVLEARPVVTLDLIDGLKEKASDLSARVLAVESRSLVPGPAGPMGPQGPQGERGENGLDGARGKDGSNGLDGKDGPAGLNGKDGSNGIDGKTGAAGRDGIDGAKGIDGKDGKDGAPGVNGKDGSNGLNGKDGAGLADAMIDRAGHLILTLSNGQTKSVGLVVGKDGADGIAGKTVDPEFVRDYLEKELSKWPRPKDGADGKDGAPGLGADDFDWDFDDETREFKIRLIRDGKVVAERTKVLEGIRIYRGVYEDGRMYHKGDVVSWNGSEWSAMDATKERPGNGSTPWKLSVKHGEKGATGPAGKPGRDGRDLTQMGPDGRKWS